MQKFRVRVTQADINRANKLINGGASRPLSCPVALAVSRALGRPVRWGTIGGRVNDSDDKVEPTNPDKVMRWVVNFDTNSMDASYKTIPVKPFSFTAIVVPLT